MQLKPWSHPTKEGFTLRGWHSSPSGKPLLHVLHGNGFCGLTYEPLLRALSPHVDLWLCDAQGHGDSDPGEGFVGWNRMAELAVEAFKAEGDAFKDVPHFAMGHSFGGVLTALMLSEHPRMFRRAVLLDPVIFPAPMALAITLAEISGMARHTPLARAALRRRRHWPDRQAAADALRGRGAYRHWREDALQAFVTHALRERDDGEVELKCHPRMEARIFSSAPTGLWSALRRITTPVHVLAGEDTLDFVIPSARQWQLHRPDRVSVDIVPGDHCFMQQFPQDTADRVQAWLLDAA